MVVKRKDCNTISYMGGIHWFQIHNIVKELAYQVNTNHKYFDDKKTTIC